MTLFFRQNSHPDTDRKTTDLSVKMSKYGLVIWYGSWLRAGRKEGCILCKDCGKKFLLTLVYWESCTYLYLCAHLGISATITEDPIKTEVEWKKSLITFNFVHYHNLFWIEKPKHINYSASKSSIKSKPFKIHSQTLWRDFSYSGFLQRKNK